MPPAFVRAQLKKLHSPDVDSLEDFQPVEPFGILIQAMVGPEGSDGEESFDIMLCTPDWLGQTMSTEIEIGRHYLFVKKFSYQKLWEFLSDYCASCQGGSWEKVAQNVARLGRWEFEDYRH